MKAVLINKPTNSEEIEIVETSIPVVRSGWVLVKVKAFGINHSEKLLRTFEIEKDYIKKPIIPGIECVGVIENPSDTHLKRGDKVIALMGGMGRSFNGSYAEYVLIPRKNVFTVRSELPFELLGAIPETYFTAWGSLFECLRLTKDDTLLVRGATCALGYAAIDIAKALGAKVIGTTHKREKLSLLNGCDQVVLDDGTLEGQLRANEILELVGPKTLRDSARCLYKGGIVCQTGLLGGVYTLDGFDPIKEIPNGCYLTGFFSNFPTQEIIDEMFSFFNKNRLQPSVGKIYRFKDIRRALIDIDEHKVDGKVVIKV
ncbi:MAG: zinc-binding dehydrogenase [Clostridia bacterium]|nr:zinc-binding dehydrogenase [Clostridia bacterium]